MQGTDLDAYPDTVVEGQDVEVGGTGAVFYRVDLGPWQEVPMDRTTGKGKVTAPRGARVLYFWDKKDPSTGTFVEVISSGSIRFVRNQGID